MILTAGHIALSAAVIETPGMHLKVKRSDHSHHYSHSCSYDVVEPSVYVKAPADARGFTDKPRPIGRGGRR